MEVFIINLLKTVAIELFSLFGIFFVLGYMLTKLQHATNNGYTRSIGWKGILLTAWFGTPIHEIGHVVMAKIFRHKIKQVSLFEPNAATGGLGHVEHEFHPYSLYQRVGNFFIGAAPMIFGSLVLLGLLYLFVPNAKEIFQSLNQEEYTLITLLDSSFQTILSLFSVNHLQNGSFYIFLYLSFCVASHIAPSEIDLKNMWSGFTWLVVLLIMTNAIPVFLGINPEGYAQKIYAGVAIFIAIFLYAIIISALHLGVITLLRLAIKR